MELTGLYVPLITPFASSGEVALSCLEDLAVSVLDGGATGLVAFGTTGEPGSLTPAERSAALDVVAGVCSDRGAPLIVGANTPSDLASLADRPGVVAALTLVPPFLRPGEEGVLAYFASLAPPVPLVVYHVPARTGQDLSPALIRRLSTLPGVVAMKYAPGVLSPDAVALFADPPDLSVLCGDDGLLSPLLALGATGAITASAHVATSAYAALVDAWRAGDVLAGRTLGNRLAPLSAALFREPNPTVIKGILYRQGRIPTPSVRLPLLPAASSTVDSAVAALRDSP
jgi:4-hydroxy-tetrahydrodipicolinate synthase